MAHPELRARLDAAREEAERAPDAQVVLTGGRSNPDVPATEARVMADALLAQGLPRGRMLLEERALDTIGNAFFCRVLLPDARELRIVTSCYHLSRATAAFRACFGPSVDVRPARCADAGSADAVASEGRRAKSARRFFEGVPPGDLRAIARRLSTEHALYKGMRDADLLTPVTGPP